MKLEPLAMLFGAAVGVAAALVHRSEPPSPLPPAAVRLTEAPPGAPEPQPVTGRLAPTGSAPAPAAAEQSPFELVAATGTTSTPGSAAPATTPERRAPIASPDELTAAEIHCYQRDAEACRRAADAYEAGRVVPRDAERARNYRRVELTQLVRGCEQASPAACIVLSGRYRAGDGVARSVKQAAALADRARTLCARHPTPACDALGMR